MWTYNVLFLKSLWFCERVQHPEHKNIRVPAVDYHLLLTFFWCCDPTLSMAFSFLSFLDHTQRRTTVGRTPLDEWSTRRRDLYMTTHNTHNRQTSMPRWRFEPAIPVSERPPDQTLDHVTAGICLFAISFLIVTLFSLHTIHSCNRGRKLTVTAHSLASDVTVL